MEAEHSLEVLLWNMETNPSWLRRARKHFEYTKFTEFTLRDFISVCNRLIDRFVDEDWHPVAPESICKILEILVKQLSVIWGENEIIFEEED